MKADIVTEALWIIALCVLIFLLIFLIVPKFWKAIAKTIALSSPSIVIRDLAGLITISGAAPHTITISYEIPTEKYSYNLEVNGRILTLEMLGETKAVKGVIKKATDEIPIDPQTSILDSKSFTIYKTREDDKNFYEVYP